MPPGSASRVHTDTPVTDLRVTGDRITELVTPRGSVSADIVVNCAGSGSAEVARMAGIELPLRPFALEMLVTEPYRPFLHPLISIIDDQAYIVQTSRLASSSPAPSPPATTPEGRRCRRELSRRCARRPRLDLPPRFPALRGVNVSSGPGAGLIDMTPDGSPD